MFCRNCGEENPKEAIYCKNCGTKLKEDEIKKSTIIETPIEEQQQTYQETTTTSNNNDGGFWDWGCCLCLLGIFIIFAIIGTQ